MPTPCPARPRAASKLGSTLVAALCALALSACDDREELGRVGGPVSARIVWHDRTYLTVAGTAHVGVPSGFDSEQSVELEVHGLEPLRLQERFDEDSEVEMVADPAGGRLAYREKGKDWRVVYVHGSHVIVGAETFAGPPHASWRFWEQPAAGPDWSQVPSFRQALRGALEAVVGNRPLNRSAYVFEAIWLEDGREAYVDFLIDTLDVSDPALGAEWERCVRDLLPDDHARVMASLGPHLQDAGPAGERARRLIAADNEREAERARERAADVPPTPRGSSRTSRP